MNPFGDAFLIENGDIPACYRVVSKNRGTPTGMGYNGRPY